MEHGYKCVKNQKGFLNAVLKKKKSKVSSETARALQVLCILKLFQMSVCGLYDGEEDVLKEFERSAPTYVSQKAEESLNRITDEILSKCFVDSMTAQKLRKSLLYTHAYHFWVKHLLRMTVAIPADHDTNKTFQPPMLKNDSRGKRKPKKFGSFSSRRISQLEKTTSPVPRKQGSETPERESGRKSIKPHPNYSKLPTKKIIKKKIPVDSWTEAIPVKDRKRVPSTEKKKDVMVRKSRVVVKKNTVKMLSGESDSDSVLWNERKRPASMEKQKDGDNSGKKRRTSLTRKEAVQVLGQKGLSENEGPKERFGPSMEDRLTSLENNVKKCLAEQRGLKAFVQESLLFQKETKVLMEKLFVVCKMNKVGNSLAAESEDATVDSAAADAKDDRNDSEKDEGVVHTLVVLEGADESLGNVAEGTGPVHVEVNPLPIEDN